MTAVGTLEIPVFLVPVDGTLELEPADGGPSHGEKLGVFSAAAGIVPGEDPEEHHQDTQEIDEIERGSVQEQVQKIEDQCNSGEAEVELIPAIPAIKEPLYEVHGRCLLPFQC